MQKLKFLLLFVIITYPMIGYSQWTKATSLPCDSFPSNLDSGIIAFYPFGSGSTDDYSGNNHHLLNVNSAISVEDRFGNPNCAYRFNNMPQSNDQYLTTANTTFLNGLSEFSISLWYKPLEDRDPGDFEALVNRDLGLRCPDRLGQWSVGLYDNRLVAFGRENSVWEGYDNVITNSGEWGYITATYNQVNKTMKLYINGNLMNTDTGRAQCGFNSYATSKDIGDLFIGKMFTGVIDDILIYNREVSPCEITELYNSESMCGLPTSLIGKNQTRNNDLLFYPNPISNSFTTNLSTEELGGRLEVYSITGETLLIINKYDGQTINLSQLTSGMYIIQYKKDSNVKIAKLIKQ